MDCKRRRTGVDSDTHAKTHTYSEASPHSGTASGDPLAKITRQI
jgi:hypothetical protein